MNQKFVSAVAMLICCAILAIVGLFGYSRYRAQQEENAAFGAELQKPAEGQPGAVSIRMPAQLPQLGMSDGAAAGDASPTPSR